MKLRTKTLLIVGATLLCLLAILPVVSRIVLLKGFTAVEDEDARRNVNRVIDALNMKIENLSVKASDWAKWDDTYEFIENGNSKYIGANLTDESIAELKLNFMLFIHQSGRLVTGKAYDVEKEESVPFPEAIKTIILSDARLIKHDDIESVMSGIILLPRWPLMIVSRPILTSENKGPIRGSLIFARYLDTSEVNLLAGVTHLSLNFVRADKKEPPPDFITANNFLLNNNNKIFLSPLSQDTIAGYSLFMDIHQKPALSIKVEMPRGIYKQGLRTMMYLIASMIVAGLCFGLLILILLEKLVVSRTARLDSDVKEIGSKGDLSARVKTEGKDELANLSISINKMLGSLEEAEALLRSRNAEMRMIMNTMPSGLLSLNEELKVNPEYSKSAEVIVGLDNLDGRGYFEILNITEDREKDRQILFDFLDLFRKEVLPERDMAELNPFREILLDRKNGFKPRWIRTQYYLIHRGEGKPNYILVVMEDITEEKLLAEKVSRSEKENMQLKAIAEDPDLFREFLIETKQILERADESVGILAVTDKRRNIVNAIFRDVHTIKGTAGSFGLPAITEIAGKLEDSLSPLRESGDISDEMIKVTKESLASLSQAIMDVVESAKKIFGEDVGDASDILLRISLQKLKSQSMAIQDLVSKNLIDTKTAKVLTDGIMQSLRVLRCVPAKKGLAKALKIIPSLINRVGKNIIFEIKGADTPIDCEIARELNTPLVHILRNALDHGIEAPGVRAEKGKPEQGNVVDKVSPILNEYITKNNI